MLYLGEVATCWSGTAIGAVALRPGAGDRGELSRTLALGLERFGIEWKRDA